MTSTHLWQKVTLSKYIKGGIVEPLGELQPLPITTIVWTNISMDFIVVLSKSNKKSIIMVVVDHLSKYAHFCALQHLFKAFMITQVFMDKIFKLHGIMQSIVMDHDLTFASDFWQESFKLNNTHLNLHTAYHLQNNGQTKAINKCLEVYL